MNPEPICRNLLTQAFKVFLAFSWVGKWCCQFTTSCQYYTGFCDDSKLFSKFLHRCIYGAGPEYIQDLYIPVQNGF